MKRRILGITALALAVLAVGAVIFVLAGGLEAIARATLRQHLVGRVDAPDLEASLGRVELRNGRLWEEGHPDHVLIGVGEGHAEVDLLRLRVTRIVLHDGFLHFRELLGTNFVRGADGSFPRLEMYDAEVRLGEDTVLSAAEAVLERNEAREYVFHGRGLDHRGLKIDEVKLRLSEHDGGADVPAAVVRLLGGGEARATLTVERSGDFRGRIQGENLDLQALSMLLGSPTRTRFGGRLVGEIQVEGSPYDLGALRARGIVRGTSLVIRDEPILLDVIALLHGVRSEETPFTEGSVRFEVVGSEIRILEAEVLGPRWGLRGEGTVDPVERTVDVEVVLVSRGARLAEIPVVGGRLQAVSDLLRERVARARIHGSWSRPKVKAAALEELGLQAIDFVRRLLTH